MKKILKNLSVFLSALILTSGFSVFAAENASITASNPQGVFSDITKVYKAGDEFDLKLYVKADEALINGALYFRFDSSTLFVEKLTAGGPLSASSPILAGADDSEYQEKNGYVACTFSDTNSLNYKTENLLLTARFKLKSSAGNQNIKVDIKSLTGIENPQNPKTMVSYIKSSSTVDENKNKFSLKAELTGGNIQPETVIPETQPLTNAPDTQPPSEPSYKPGDVNRDGALSIKDATLIQKHIAKLETFDDEQKQLADINGDNRVNIKDATKIQHIIAGLI